MLVVVNVGELHVGAVVVVVVVDIWSTFRVVQRGIGARDSAVH